MNGQIANFYTKSSQILNLLPFVTLLQVLAAANPTDMQTHFIRILCETKCRYAPSEHRDGITVIMAL